MSLFGSSRTKIMIVIFNMLVFIIYLFIVVKNTKELRILDIILLATMPLISYIFTKKYVDT
ncbi:MAG: hypothetical protein QXL96_00590 [Ignisphaera sp.]